MRHYNISFAGAGRVADVLGKALHGAGHSIRYIVSNDGENGKDLACILGGQWRNDLNFGDSSEIIIVAVNDNMLPKVLADISCGENTSIVHTAGSYGLDVFPQSKHKIGVFYPVQTFSRGRYINLTNQPFLIESPDKGTLAIMEDMVKSLCAISYITGAEQRKILHVAAVFANNFTNHMLFESKKIMEESGLPFEILEPLVKETISKAFEIGPAKSQTGPAIRNDSKTLNLHADLLSFDPNIKQLYSVITKSIVDNYK